MATKHRTIFTVIYVGVVALCAQAQAATPAFQQGILEFIKKEPKIVEFYQQNGFEELWTDRSRQARKRIEALFDAISTAHVHGLPARRYDASKLRKLLETIESPRNAARAEIMLSKAFISYASDLQTGALNPGRVNSEIKRARRRLDVVATLKNFHASSPRGYFAALIPNSREYKQLVSEKMRLIEVAQSGGWGDIVPSKQTLRPGEQGASVIALRNRLMRMGYIRRSLAASYDDTIVKGVSAFQRDHGLGVDGVAGPTTLSELNVSVEQRIRSISVALERERWVNTSRSGRHVIVNLADFSAKIYDGERLTFETRSVVGANKKTHRSPEFSDVMEFMVINPSWYVPRSIVVKEYLPMLQKNASAVSNLQLLDTRGKKVSRANVDFTQYTKSTFPFSLKEPPSEGNALGLVKFMFPNQYNIYLHDTPSKSLFNKETRTFSHGCIRLQNPIGFAHALLAKQTADPEGTFQNKLKTGRETVVNLKENVPVHLIYRTAFTNERGEVRFRRDIYGRDAEIYDALVNAGLDLAV